MKMDDELWNSSIIETVYKAPNYKILDMNNNSNICIICFSSNGIYYPNTVDTFNQVIVGKDYYEWENVCCSAQIEKYAKRIIFVRDIYKQWYVSGISKVHDSIDTLYGLLLQLTQGYEIITLGGSSGGYAAVILGIKLKAKKVYSFSGQFSIENEIKDYFLLTKYKNTKKYSQYYELKDLVKNNKEIPIYYFYPAKCRQDCEQFEYIAGLPNVYVFGFNYSTHATTTYGCNFQYLIVKSNEEMQRLCRRCRNRAWSKAAFLLISTDIFTFFKEMKKR